MIEITKHDIRLLVFDAYGTRRAYRIAVKPPD